MAYFSQEISTTSRREESVHRASENSHIPATTVHRLQADGVSMFYRQAGAPEAPVVLLLHGFPHRRFTRAS